VDSAGPDTHCLGPFSLTKRQGSDLNPLGIVL